MVTTNIQTADIQSEGTENFAKIREQMADSDPHWNPRAHELYFQHETEIDNIEALLPEGVEVSGASGTKLRAATGTTRATDEECRKFEIDFPSLEFDIEDDDIAAEIADKLQEFAAQLLRASIDIRYADLKYVEPDEGDGDDEDCGESAAA